RVIHETSRRNTLEQSRIRTNILQRIPSHMRRFQLLAIERRRKPFALRRKVTKTISRLRLRRSLIQPLQSYADPQERHSIHNRNPRSLRELEIMQQLRRLKVPHTWQHDLLRMQHLFRRLRHHNIARTEIPQRLHHAGQIPRLVINHRDHRRARLASTRGQYWNSSSYNSPDKSATRTANRACASAIALLSIAGPISSP